MFRSANTVVEAFGEAGVAAAQIGKNLVSFKNQITLQFEKPLIELASKVIKDPAELIELNTMINHNAALAGRRFYKDGKIWIPTPGIKQKTINEAMLLPEADFLAWVNKGMASQAEVNGVKVEATSANVREMMDRFQVYGRHMYEMKNTARKAVGADDLTDIGLWIPAMNPRDKHIAYVHDMLMDSTTMLYAKSPEELNSMVAHFNSSLAGRSPGTFRIVTKDMQEDFNKIANRHDSLYMSVADSSMQHGGASARSTVSTNTETLSEIINGYQYHVNKGVDDIVQLNMASTFEHLRNVSAISNRGYSPNTLGTIQKGIHAPADPGQVMKNVILGRSNLAEHSGWANWQNGMQIYTDLALQTVSDVLKPITSLVSKNTVRTEEDWAKLAKQLEDKGIPNPFAMFDKEMQAKMYIREGTTQGTRLTNRAITLSNSLAATMLLKVGEVGQAFVNMVSLPILTSGAINRKMQAQFTGAALDPNAKFSVHAAMYDGIRMMNHPTLGPQFSAYAHDANLFVPVISEANDLLHMAKSLEPGIMGRLEDGLQSSLVNILSKPSDYSETLVRKMAYFTGVGMAKKAYPGISDRGAVIFARNFMDEAVGNYSAHQRPAMFQGTFGTALGLFQTYMLTMAQQIYRGLENRNWAALGKQLLTQQTIFGASSLPGFHIVSEGIGNHFSDNNVDLQTGTFRALSDPLANVLLYGLPSSFGPGIVTRGDIQPRLPNPFQGLDSIAAVNFAKQGFAASERIATAIGTANASTGRAVLEAISLQSLSRPMARLSELATGSSITSRGEVVADNLNPNTVDNLFSLSTVSRIMSTRPLQEIKAREALHLNSVYGAADAQKRKNVAFALKQNIRGDTLSDETLEKLSEQYLRTGTVTGWKSAVNQAIAQSKVPATSNVMDKFKKGSPLNLMIEDLDYGDNL